VHRTMTPMGKVYDRGKKNVAEGRRAYLLVPPDHVQSAPPPAQDAVPRGGAGCSSVRGAARHALSEAKNGSSGE
jgi:hypothetical protein